MRHFRIDFICYTYVTLMLPLHNIYCVLFPLVKVCGLQALSLCGFVSVFICKITDVAFLKQVYPFVVYLYCLSHHFLYVSVDFFVSKSLSFAFRIICTVSGNLTARQTRKSVCLKRCKIVLVIFVKLSTI